MRALPSFSSSSSAPSTTTTSTTKRFWRQNRIGRKTSNFFNVFGGNFSSKTAQCFPLVVCEDKIRKDKNWIRGTLGYVQTDWKLSRCLLKHLHTYVSLFYVVWRYPTWVKVRARALGFLFFLKMWWARFFSILCFCFACDDLVTIFLADFASAPAIPSRTLPWTSTNLVG